MTPSLPEWVEKRDGRREPFDADKISESLFGATETIGAPNAFLARELTDSVLHFLGQENEAETIATGQIADVVEKVVRELGQPELAQAFSSSKAKTETAGSESKRARQTLTFTHHGYEHPETIVGLFLESYSLQAVYSRDLAAAHESELLELSDLQAPQLMHAVVAEPIHAESSTTSWKCGWAQVREGSRRAARAVVVDGAEWLVAGHGPNWLDGFFAGLECHGRYGVLNIGTATPPTWATQLHAGPLFASVLPMNDADRHDACKAILEARLPAHSTERCPWQVNWHIQQADFADARNRDLLQWWLTQSDRLNWFDFTFDRPRRPVALSEGLSRDHPAVCLHVGLQLADLLAHRGIEGDGNKFIAKLPSLVRMAVSAGVQKRNYLRRANTDLSRAFLLDRACLLIEPWKLEHVVEAIAGGAKSKLALEAERQVVKIIRDAAVQAGQAAGLDVVLDLESEYTLPASDDSSAFWRSVGGLSEVMNSSVIVHLGDLCIEAIWRELRHAWQTPGISRVQFWRNI